MVAAVPGVPVSVLPCPLAALIEQLQRDAAQAQIDEWVVPRLARLQSPRAVPTLHDAYLQIKDPDQQVWLAAALLAHRQPGQEALRALHLSTDADGEASVLADALALIEHQIKSVTVVIHRNRIRTSGRGLSGP